MTWLSPQLKEVSVGGWEGGGGAARAGEERGETKHTPSPSHTHSFTSGASELSGAEWEGTRQGGNPRQREAHRNCCVELLYLYTLPLSLSHTLSSFTHPRASSREPQLPGWTGQQGRPPHTPAHMLTHLRRHTLWSVPWCSKEQ